MTYGEAMSALLVSGYLAVHRDPKAEKADLPFPWASAPVTFSAEEIAQAEAVLAARVKFASDED